MTIMQDKTRRLSVFERLAQACVTGSMFLSMIGFLGGLSASAVQDVSAIQNRINEQCLSEPKLKGAIVLLTQSGSNIESVFIYDVDRGEEQLAALRSMVAATETATIEIAAIPLSFKKLYDETSRVFKEITGDSGSLVQSICFQARDGILEFCPIGRFSSMAGHIPFDSQRDRLEKSLMEFIERETALGSSPKVSHKVVDLTRIRTPGKTMSDMSFAAKESEGADAELEKLTSALLEFEKVRVKNKALHGSFFQAIQNLDSSGRVVGIDLYLWIDKAIPSQKDLLLAEFKKLVNPIPVSLANSSTLPITEILDELELQTLGNSKLDGCSIKSCYFYPVIENGMITSIGVFPFGRAVNQASADNLIQAFEQLFRDKSGELPIFPYLSFSGQNNIAGLKILALRLEMAEASYAEGLRKYFSNNYSDADKLFDDAISDDPRSIVYRYWKILSKLQQGANDEAYSLMVATSRRFRSENPTYGRGEIAQSLNRIQGPIRGELMELERKSLADIRN